jgi:hypothetical protein
MLRLDLHVSDLAGTRFAMSPLFETVASLRALRDPGRHGLHLPWVRWAQEELAREPLRLPLTWELLVEPEHFREFLIPAPASRLPELDEELERLLATPRAYARERLGRPPRLRALAAELREAHARLIAPSWDRMRALLDADIVHRSAELADGGALALFAGLHPELSWHADHLIARDGPRDEGPPRPVVLGPDGLVLQPSVFLWPELYVKPFTITQTTIRYPARGVAALWEPTERQAGADEAVARLLGARRAEVLAMLRAPGTTSQLARRLGVTPSAVSQQLRVLRGAGLVSTARVGRGSVHQLTGLGARFVGGR